VVAPTHTSAAQASVHDSCTISRCSAPRTARSSWSQLGWPLSKGWYSWPYGQYNYTGGTFQNREGEFPPTRPTTSTTSTRGHGEPRGTATASWSTAP
jgi:ribonuclease T1